jgi:hypothetical protein
MCHAAFLASVRTPWLPYSLRTQNQRPNASCQGLNPLGRPLQLPNISAAPANSRQISALQMVNPQFAESLAEYAAIP